jgi:hypothetical protein
MKKNIILIVVSLTCGLVGGIFVGLSSGKIYSNGFVYTKADLQHMEMTQHERCPDPIFIDPSLDNFNETD